jgi:hypothetical protein
MVLSSGSEQPAEKAADSGEHALEQAEDAGEQAADRLEETADETHVYSPPRRRISDRLRARAAASFGFRMRSR